MRLEWASQEKGESGDLSSVGVYALLPLLAACAALQLATVSALSGTAVATNINRLVEVAIDAFDDGIFLSDLFTGRNFFECHPGDLRLLVERVSSFCGEFETLAVERVGDTVAVINQSFGETSLADRWKTTFLVDLDELLTAPVRDIAAKLHRTGNQETKSVTLSLVT
jgi:hypothetical protein